MPESSYASEVKVSRNKRIRPNQGFVNTIHVGERVKLNNLFNFRERRTDYVKIQILNPAPS